MAVRGSISCDLGAEAVVLNVKEGVYYGLSPVASRVWMLVQVPREPREICEILVQEYEVSEADCLSDLFDLLESMLERKLIEVVNSKPTRSLP